MREKRFGQAQQENKMPHVGTYVIIAVELVNLKGDGLQSPFRLTSIFVFYRVKSALSMLNFLL